MYMLSGPLQQKCATPDIKTVNQGRTFKILSGMVKRLWSPEEMLLLTNGIKGGPMDGGSEL